MLALIPHHRLIERTNRAAVKVERRQLIARAAVANVQVPRCVSGVDDNVRAVAVGITPQSTFVAEVLTIVIVGRSTGLPVDRDIEAIDYIRTDRVGVTHGKTLAGCIAGGSEVESQITAGNCTRCESAVKARQTVFPAQVLVPFDPCIPGRILLTGPTKFKID